MMKLSLQEDFTNTTDIIWALSSEIRLKILQLISGDKEYRSKDLIPYIDCGVSNLSQQLKILEDAGLIVKERIKDGSTSKLIRPVFKGINIEL
jgi:predicted transcriptional regulator